MDTPILARGGADGVVQDGAFAVQLADQAPRAVHGSMVHACSIPLMPEAQLAAYGVGIIALIGGIGGIATVARGSSRPRRPGTLSGCRFSHVPHCFWVI